MGSKVGGAAPGFEPRTSCLRVRSETITLWGLPHEKGFTYYICTSLSLTLFKKMVGRRAIKKLPPFRSRCYYRLSQFNRGLLPPFICRQPRERKRQRLRRRRRQEEEEVAIRVNGPRSYRESEPEPEPNHPFLYVFLFPLPFNSAGGGESKKRGGGKGESADMGLFFTAETLRFSWAIGIS